MTAATEHTAIGGAESMLRAQRIEQFWAETWNRLDTGGALPDGLDVFDAMCAWHDARIERAVSAYLLQRVPAANDGAPGPLAA